MSPGDIAAHLSRHYSTEITGLTELDRGVFRADRRDGPPWVARVFPASRRMAEAEGDAAILDFLHHHDFPAERSAHDHPVLAHDQQAILVTEFVAGHRPRFGPGVFHRLGVLLGRLHTLPAGPGAVSRPGGAWHHLAAGAPRAEIDAAAALLTEAAPRLQPSQQALYQELCSAVDGLDDGEGLPQALLHPDFVPANVIARPADDSKDESADDLVLVDWTGAGRGPRLWSLGFLLWAAGARDLDRVDAVLAGYRTQADLEPAELDRLPGAILARPVIFGCWAFATGRQSLPAAAEDLHATRDLAHAIAHRALTTLHTPPTPHPHPTTPASHPRGAASATPSAGPAVTPGLWSPPTAPAAAARPAGTRPDLADVTEGPVHAADLPAASHPQPDPPGPASPLPLDGVAATALTIASIRAQESARPDRLFHDPLAAAFVAATGYQRRDQPADRRAAVLRIWVVARTLFLDELLLDAAAAGCSQVVLLGAGLDARAFRLPWPPGVRCFELDTADVLDGKQQVLAAQSAAPTCERVPVACDLRADWPGVLLAAGFTPDQPAVWVAEGLLVYLEPAEVEAVLADLSALSAPASRLGLTLTNRAAASYAQSSLPRPGLRRSAAPEDPVQWLAGHGWTADLTEAREVLRAHGRPLPDRAGDQGSGPAGERRPQALLIRAVKEESSVAQPPASRSNPRPAQRPQRKSAQPKSAQPKSAQPDPAHARPAPPPAAAGSLPLSALLSQALVAFTIECDNEFEHQMPRSTTRPGAGSGGRRGPWLTSLVMWATCTRWVGEDWMPVTEMEERAKTGTNLAGMHRWRYIDVDPDPVRTKPKPPKSRLRVRATRAGLAAQRVWPPLPGLVEQRWAGRFGASAVEDLAGALRAVVGQIDLDLPDCLPILGQPLRTYRQERPWPPRPGGPPDVSGLPLVMLLARVLLAFAIDYESVPGPALAIAANTLRVLDQDGVRIRDLPVRSGVSKEATAMALGHLLQRKLAVEEPDPAAGRGKVVRLTPAGLAAQQDYDRLVATVEQRWTERFVADSVRDLRQALTPLVGDPAQPSPLLASLEPYPDGWRASVRPPATLPHYPMILHRGGYPDGS